MDGKQLISLNNMNLNINKLYNEYVTRCYKKPKSFSEFITIFYKIKFHKEIIRPQIIRWQELKNK